MNIGLVRAVFRKDLQSLRWLVALTALLFLMDALIVRLHLLPLWTEWNLSLLVFGPVPLILSVFQQDSPASLTDDWLCRPVGKAELIAAKLLLLLFAVYLPRAAGIFAADSILGVPLADSILDALLLQEKAYLFLLPLFLLIAAITRTFVQGLLVMLGIFICVIVLPTPFVRPPGPLTPGIRDALFASGMAWLPTLPARVACLALVALGFWLAYWRRHLWAARVLLGLTVCVTLFFVVLPMALPWPSTFALQKLAGPDPRTQAARVYLRNPHACLAATRLVDLPNDPAMQTSRLAHWEEEEQLQGVGPDSIAFVTAIEARGLPLDWRAKLNYVQADYSIGGNTLYSLRPAQYLTDQRSGGSLSHGWLLPELAVRRLQGEQPQLRLGYSLTLLKPREHSLTVNGAWQALPELGVCRATATAADHLDVECISTVSHPAQISAELKDIPASRVYGPVDFAPRWAKRPYSDRLELTIDRPQLSAHSAITLTAWENAGHIDEALTLPGLLGGDAHTCPLPIAGSNYFSKARWRDAAPHESSMINVDQGVQLEVLDFGGTGTPIVLLPGLGATAHSFDELAPQLAQKHRVIAITRRGTGYSSRPDFGFDTPRLARDVLAVMDQMALSRVLLVGHSIAGDELTWLGGHHGERFSGLVYLDAAYDRSGDIEDNRHTRLRELQASLPPEPPRPPEALLDYPSMSMHLEARGHLQYPEGELIAFLNFDKPHLAGTPNLDVRAAQAIKAAIRAPDYSKVRIPALAVFAIEDPDKAPPPWIAATDAAAIAALAEIRRLTQTLQRESMAVFREQVAHGQVLALPNAAHNLVLSNPREVRQAIEAFAASP
jgi:non-heme chloroperoxidase